jgi:hypothetical protein
LQVEALHASSSNAVHAQNYGASKKWVSLMLLQRISKEKRGRRNAAGEKMSDENNLLQTCFYETVRLKYVRGTI